MSRKSRSTCSERPIRQRHFAQSGQITFAKEILRGPFRTFPEIHLPFGEARPQLIGGKIDQHDFVGQIEDRIGHRFLNRDTANLPNGIAAARDMLNVQRCINVDPGVQQLENVLIPFRMPRTGCVGMRELVNDRNTGMPRQNCVEIHFAQFRAAVFKLQTRHDGQTFEQCFGFFAPVRFNDANDDFAALLIVSAALLAASHRFCPRLATYRRRS